MCKAVEFIITIILKVSLQRLIIDPTYTFVGVICVYSDLVNIKIVNIKPFWCLY